MPVYSPDPADSWNRVFHAFPPVPCACGSRRSSPAQHPWNGSRMGFPDLPVSTRIFERSESGDRAIEPLDPFLVHAGSRRARQRVLVEPSFTGSASADRRTS